VTLSRFFNRSLHSIRDVKCQDLSSAFNTTKRKSGFSSGMLHLIVHHFMTVTYGTAAIVADVIS
jgi:hypothetical protein